MKSEKCILEKYTKHFVNDKKKDDQKPLLQQISFKKKNLYLGVSAYNKT